MNIYWVDHTVSDAILKSQLLDPLLIAEINGIILVPKNRYQTVKDYVDLSNLICIPFESKKEIIPVLLKNENSYVYTRSIVQFFYLYFFRIFYRLNVKIVYDFRGIPSREILIKNNYNLKSRFKSIILRLAEVIVLKSSDYVYTVSHNFKNYLLNISNSKRSIVVIPCCTLKNHNQSSAEKSGFVYVGSINQWQQFDVVLDMFKRIKKIDNLACLTIITRDVEIAKAHTLKEQIDAEIISLSQKEVLSELVKYKFGFLLREDNIVNQTASPVKFAEYLNAGVIPIMTDSVGDYSDIVEENDIGIVLKKSSQLLPNDIVKFNLNDQSKNKLAIIASDYLWNVHADKLDFKKLYDV